MPYSADGHQPALESPCAPSLARTLHGQGCRLALSNSSPPCSAAGGGESPLLLSFANQSPAAILAGIADFREVIRNLQDRASNH